MLPDEIRQSMQNPFQIDRRSNLGRKALLNEYVNKNLPVILTDAAKDWPAIGKWTPEFFKTHYGHLTKELDGRLNRSTGSWPPRRRIPRPILTAWR